MRQLPREAGRCCFRNPEGTRRATSVNVQLLRLHEDLRMGSISRDILTFPSCRRRSGMCHRRCAMAGVSFSMLSQGRFVCQTHTYKVLKRLRLMRHHGIPIMAHLQLPECCFKTCHMLLKCARVATFCNLLPHLIIFATFCPQAPMKVDYGELRHFCDEPVCPDPVWMLSTASHRRWTPSSSTCSYIILIYITLYYVMLYYSKLHYNIL